MRAVWMEGRGGLEVLRYGEIEEPEVGPGEVRVRVRAVALNHLDLWVRKGVAAPNLALPHILGSDIAGVVETVGPGAQGVVPGEEVVVNPGVSCGRCERCLSGQDNLCPDYQILGEHRWGGYAELVVVPVVNVLPKPKNLGFAEAAAVPLTFLTAWQMVVDKLQVKPGEDVLVMAAGSGVSVAAIQIAKLYGARVIAAAGSEEKLEKARALGADEVVNYSQPDWSKEVRRLTGGKGADAVVDHTGAAYWEGVIKATAWGGRISLVGASSGYQAPTPLSHVFYRQLTILGSTMASKSRLYPILRWVAQG
ncbi:MAG: zinc-binding dehydrogenase, partial [Meiothermus sp.]|nr:zinc-binding dehydrogenase [Meiothermus sp.]